MEWISQLILREKILAKLTGSSQIYLGVTKITGRKKRIKLKRISIFFSAFGNYKVPEWCGSMSE